MAVSNECTWSIIEDQMGKPTAADFREVVERETGIDFCSDSPFDMTRQDWKNLVHYLDTEPETADNSETEGGTE